MNTSKNYGKKSYAEAADKVEEYETVEEKFHAFLPETASTFLEPRKHLRANLIKCSGVEPPYEPRSTDAVYVHASIIALSTINHFELASNADRYAPFGTKYNKRGYPWERGLSPLDTRGYNTGFRASERPQICRSSGY